MNLFGLCQPLQSLERSNAESLIKRHHYAHAVPSGKSHYFNVEGAIVVYSIPANCNAAAFILGEPGNVWELTRLWAPDGHAPNLLTRAISITVKALLLAEPNIDALISYADPNVGHSGGIYRAASWIYTGQSEEARYILRRRRPGRSPSQVPFRLKGADSQGNNRSRLQTRKKAREASFRKANQSPSEASH